MVAITWLSHSVACEKCRDVDIEKSQSFAGACVLGSKLIMEELVIRQRPSVADTAKKVEDWARKAGVFKIGKSTYKAPPKYAGES